MRPYIVLVLWMLAMQTEACPTSLDFSFRPLLASAPVKLCDEYAGKVVLVVNTASQCGFTSQYEGLEKLYQELRGRGFVVLGFPSNDFGGQEPGSEADIQKFCRSIYGIQFPMFEKTSVKKGQANPLFAHLAAVTGTAPRWNFYKYLIDREGRVVKAYSSITGPSSGRLRQRIDELL